MKNAKETIRRAEEALEKVNLTRYPEKADQVGIGYAILAVAKALLEKK